MKKPRVGALSAVLALLGSPPAVADLFASGSMVVFTADGQREIALAPAPAPTLTVFTPDGTRAVAIDADWPRMQGNGYLNLSAGYRHDKLSFNIAADRRGAATPNILSELTWEIPAAELRLDGSWTHASGFTAKAYLAYAHASSAGKVQDSDYALNDRQGEFSRSYADPGDSQMLDVSLGAGWRFPLAGLSSVTPMLGLARQESELRSRQGRQVLWDSDHARRVGIAGSVPLGEFAGLDSSYQPVWESVWVGLDGEFRPSERLSLRGGLKQHWFRYKAEADWNLRDDLAHPVSFRHQGDGTGWQAEVGADWLVVPGHKLTLNVSGSRFTLQDGKDTTYFRNGRSVDLRLNEVIADTWSARLGYQLDY